MSNEDNSVWVAFNGEIYNHKTRRRQLGEQGHQFRTQCDTEVIVHEWEEHGPNCVDWLDGQFGFAVWDLSAQTLMLARDRLGIKPLYYHWNGSRLVFSSEIKGILASNLVPADLGGLGLRPSDGGRSFGKGERVLKHLLEFLVRGRGEDGHAGHFGQQHHVE